jgi:hypothetical protein
MGRGDHIYVDYGTFTHHGIDCGDGTVIHYRKLNQTIAKTSMEELANGKQVLVKRYGKCDLPDIAIQRAESRLGENGYCLFGNNCEHFAKWCKTGIHASEQVNNAGAVAGGAYGGGAAVAGGIGVVGAVGAAAGLSGAGIMSGLATVGGVVGGGAVAPAAISILALDKVLVDDESLPDDEREARAVGRTMTTIGAAVGAAGAVGSVAVAGSVAGLSAAGITSGLAAVGATVGGGMAAGVAVTVAAPAVAAAAVGYSAYKIWRKWISE